MKVVIPVPEFVSEEEIREVVRKYIKKKEKFKRFYELVEGVDWDELKKSVENSEGTSDSEDLMIDTLIEFARSKKLELLEGSYISVITLLEFLRYYKDLLESIFKIVGIDNDVILTYCELYNALKEKGLLIGDADLLIASTAISKNLILYTFDEDFKRLESLGLKLWRCSE